MGAHSSPALHTPPVHVIDSSDVSLTRDERGYLKELLRTYKHMFAEVMTAEKYNNCSDHVKREQYQSLQKAHADSILRKLVVSEEQLSQEVMTRNSYTL